MLTQSDIELVQDSFNWAYKDKTTLVKRFYNRLFTVAPHMKMLFSGDVKKQHTMLISIMSTILKGLDDPDRLHAYLYMLGEDHAKMGVRSDYYQVFCEVFIETMLTTVGQPKDDVLEMAWRNALETITFVMKKATLDSGAEIQSLRA